MKKLLMLMTLLVVVSIVAESQVIQGPKGSVFNEATQFYRKASFVGSTANDTTGFISFYPASDIAIFERSNDSVHVALYYQLRNSTLNKNRAWTLLDSTNTATDVGTDGAMDTVMVCATRLAVATTSGYDQIRFFVDYLSGDALTSTSANGDGSVNVFRLYYYFVLPQFKR